MVYTLAIFDSYSNFFDTVVQFLTSIWSAVEQAFTSLKELLEVVFLAVEANFELYPSLWTPLATCVFLVTVLGVVKLIAGR